MKKLIAALMAAAILLSLCACGNTSAAPSNSNGSKKNTINLNDYVVFSETGYDHHGKCYPKFDYDSFFNENADALDLEKYKAEKFSSDVSATSEQLLESMKGAISSTHPVRPEISSEADGSKSSNGDTVHIGWNVDEKYYEMLCGWVKKDLTYSGFDHTVTGLTPLIPIDFFENYIMTSHDASGSGHYPTGAVKIPTRDNDIACLEPVSTERDGMLSNGDVVHYKINERLVDWIESELGYTPTRTEADIVLDCFH